MVLLCFLSGVVVFCISFRRVLFLILQCLFPGLLCSVSGIVVSWFWSCCVSFSGRIVFASDLGVFCFWS